MLFEKQIQFIDELKASLFSTLQSVINDNGYVITEYITEKQLYDKGIDGDGLPLRNKQTGRLGYSRITIRIKKAKGQPTDRVTLRDKEKYHPSITVEAYPDRFEVSSDISYAKYLVKRYGKNIMKPTKENMVEFFKTYYLPELKKLTDDKFTR